MVILMQNKGLIISKKYSAYTGTDYPVEYLEKPYAERLMPVLFNEANGDDWEFKNDEVSCAFSLVEKVARVCYKSEDKITHSIKDNARFLSMLIRHEHYAMLEHAVFCFRTNSKLVRDYFVSCPFAKIWEVSYEDLVQKGFYNIQLNLRSILEAPLYASLGMRKALLDSLYFKKYGKDSTEVQELGELILLPNFRTCSPNSNEKTFLQELFMRYYTILMITDRGVSHELVRHRVVSYAQESTRYCNYSGKPVKMMLPTGFENWSEEVKMLFLLSTHESVVRYTKLLNMGLTPQQARAVLPNALATTIVMTVSREELKHIYDLRLIGTTGKPHPDMQSLMKEVYTEVPIDGGYIISL